MARQEIKLTAWLNGVRAYWQIESVKGNVYADAEKSALKNFSDAEIIGFSNLLASMHRGLQMELDRRKEKPSDSTEQEVQQ